MEARHAIASTLVLLVLGGTLACADDSEDIREARQVLTRLGERTMLQQMGRIAVEVGPLIGHRNPAIRTLAIEFIRTRDFTIRTMDAEMYNFLVRETNTDILRRAFEAQGLFRSPAGTIAAEAILAAPAGSDIRVQGTRLVAENYYGSDPAPFQTAMQSSDPALRRLAVVISYRYRSSVPPTQLVSVVAEMLDRRSADPLAYRLVGAALLSPLAHAGHSPEILRPALNNARLLMDTATDRRLLEDLLVGMVRAEPDSVRAADMLARVLRIDNGVASDDVHITYRTLTVNSLRLHQFLREQARAGTQYQKERANAMLTRLDRLDDPERLEQVLRDSRVDNIGSRLEAAHQLIALFGHEPQAQARIGEMLNETDAQVTAARYPRVTSVRLSLALAEERNLRHRIAEGILNGANRQPALTEAVLNAVRDSRINPAALSGLCNLVLAAAAR